VVSALLGEVIDVGEEIILISWGCGGILKEEGWVGNWTSAEEEIDWGYWLGKSWWTSVKEGLAEGYWLKEGIDWSIDWLLIYWFKKVID
jgi:hypothetical protein